MRITQVTVNFTETCNLGDYSNTKPSIELTALLDAGDDVHAVIDGITALAKGVIHDKIDEELELCSKPPKYWQGERYDVIYSVTSNFVAIVPAKSVVQLDGGFYHYSEGVRHPTALRTAQAKRDQLRNQSVRFFDCGMGDPVTALYEYTTEQNAIYEQKRMERRHQEEEERRRQQADLDALLRTLAEEEE